MIPFLFLVPAEMIHVLHYDGFSTISAFTSSVETNTKEFSEFLHNYRLYFYLLIPVALALSVSHFFFIPRSLIFSKRTRLIIGATFTIVFCAFSFKAAHDSWSRSHKLNDVAFGLKELYQRMFTQNYPYAYIPKIYKYTSERMEFRKALAAKKDFRFGAYTDKITLEHNKPLIVIVIGESSRANNWSLGGYARNTNPLLSRREDLYYCKDTTSSATQTRESVELALTRASPRNLTPIYNEKSLVTAYKEAGYSTIWISNQKMTGGVDTAIYEMAKEADETHFIGSDYRYKNSYDEKILPVLKEVLITNNHKPTLLVIHTIGSHEIYRMRYPPGFEKFKPASKGDDYNWNSPGLRERLLNSYDNSILYTDYVLNSFISLLSQQSRNIGLIFFSDHGENILDDGSDRFGHGGVVPTKYVIHIPMFFWFSGGFVDSYPDKVGHIKTNCLKPVSENYVFDTMLDLGGIKIKGYQASNSMASNADFKSERFILDASLKPILNTSVK